MDKRDDRRDNRRDYRRDDRRDAPRERSMDRRGYRSPDRRDDGKNTYIPNNARMGFRVDERREDIRDFQRNDRDYDDRRGFNPRNASPPRFRDRRNDGSPPRYSDRNVYDRGERSPRQIGRGDERRDFDYNDRRGFQQEDRNQGAVRPFAAADRRQVYRPNNGNN